MNFVLQQLSSQTMFIENSTATASSELLVANCSEQPVDESSYLEPGSSRTQLLNQATSDTKTLAKIYHSTDKNMVFFIKWNKVKYNEGIFITV